MYHHEHDVGRFMNVKDVFDEFSEGIEKHVPGHWRKGNLCCKVTKSLLDCSSARC